MAIQAEVIDAILAERGPLSIAQLAEAAISRGAFDDGFQQEAFTRLARIELRKFLREQKQGDGWPKYANILTHAEDGGDGHLYVQEAFLDVDGYRQVVAGHARTAKHHFDMASGYAERCFVRFNVQIPLPIEVREYAPV